jgi:uncharacterized protein (DUF1330 family)
MFGGKRSNNKIHRCSDPKIANAGKYKEYKKLTPSSITAFDRKFIVRGGK